MARYAVFNLVQYNCCVIVIENEQLRPIFLMLRDELKDSDIPHRTTIGKRILEVWDEHLDRLEREMELGCYRQNLVDNGYMD
ncbi:hypothetical protein DFH09DRAFT_277755 [Mycena vulgaris]|nr:hypothetical protein DFH09DRAFT_277755 [Mycena vulgaris]